MISITLTIIILSVVISIMAFRDHALMAKLIFYPPAVQSGEWYRLLSYGVLHADFTHLIFNMFTLYLFGTAVENACKAALGSTAGGACFLTLYVLSLSVSILPTYFKQKSNAYYRSLGASGAVSAVVFAYILINPMSFMGILFIPIMLPAFLFGIIFILISVRLDKQQTGGINHSAHITGGIFGILFTIAAFMIIGNINLLQHFFNQIHIQSIGDLIHFGY